MLYLIAVESDIGCEAEGNDLEEGLHTKDSCDASIQSIDDLNKKQPHQDFRNLFTLCPLYVNGKAMLCLSCHFVIPCLMLTVFFLGQHMQAQDKIENSQAYRGRGCCLVTCLSRMIIALR